MLEIFGGPDRDRTDDLFHAMEARSLPCADCSEVTRKSAPFEFSFPSPKFKPPVRRRAPQQSVVDHPAMYDNGASAFFRFHRSDASLSCSTVL